jgi:restriction system protein
LVGLNFNPKPKFLMRVTIRGYVGIKNLPIFNVKCPNCKKSMALLARQCPFCGFDFYSVKRQAPHWSGEFEKLRQKANDRAVKLSFFALCFFFTLPSLLLFITIVYNLSIDFLGIYLLLCTPFLLGLIYWYKDAGSKAEKAGLNILVEIKERMREQERFEKEQKEKGLVKFVSFSNRVKWGTPEQVREWKIIDTDIRNNFVNLTPRQFEKLVAYLFQQMGYITRLTPQTADYGADIVARKDGDIIIIEVKKYSIRNTVGNREIQRLLGSMYHYKANKAIFVTSSTFTDNAYQQASRAPVELWDRRKLCEMIDRWLLTDSGLA